MARFLLFLGMVGKAVGCGRGSSRLGDGDVAQANRGSKIGCPYGTHRVIEPRGGLPQAAWRLDNSGQIFDNEILLDVRTLNIDAASFKQIVSTCRPDASKAELEEHVAVTVMKIVSERGKMQNPVTGSGGMLLGTVREFGSRVQGARGTKVGDLVATLVSLSLTPLRLESVTRVDLDKDQVDVIGQAVLFESGPFAVIPEDIGERLALALLDVAGAPAQTARLVQPGDSVLILGAGGKSGLICSAVARQKGGPKARIIGLAHGKASTERAKALGAADVLISADATDALGLMKQVVDLNDGKKVDLTINCVNVPGTEMASILSTRQRGKVYFFSMATSFTAAALGAEGAGADVDLLIGNGYAEGHAEAALDLARSDARLRGILEGMFPG